MWFPQGLGLPISLLGLAAQVPLEQPTSIINVDPTQTKDFAFKEGDDVFSPRNLVELARPGTGLANSAGDLVLVPVSKYSLKEKKNNKSIFLAPIETSIKPLSIPLANGGEAFWIDPRTVGHAVDEGEGKDKVKVLYAISLKVDTNDATISTFPDSPVLIGKLPTATASNFIFNGKSEYLIFSDNVYEDGDITKVKEHDEAWENRGDTAHVYDETFDRHWDTWVGPKKSSLFSVKLIKVGGKYVLGTNYINLLNGTGHHAPIEPFGGTDDFDVSGNHVVYTTKDPKLPPAWHTKQDIYIVDFDGKNRKELTSGKQGATHNPTFNAAGDKVAWIELDQDGHESDRGKIVIYDLAKDVRYTLTQHWDRTANVLSFSPDDDILYFTAGDIARVKIFVLPTPPTPESSTTDPDLPKKYRTPTALTHDGTASGVQALPNGRVLFTQNTLTSPNDVFVIRGLDRISSLLDASTDLKDKLEFEQLTKFTEDDLKGKTLSKGEDFWFEGAEGRKIHGWLLKPPGFKEGEKKKWPVVLLIHGGPEGAWEDGWSTRWNPNVFAQQGYVVVAINPTGSTTFGQELTNAIKLDWGGAPFVDLTKGWKYILDKYPEIDADRAVGAGASYGGYSANWIQGHPEFGFNFKALVTHDGALDVRYTAYATDELFFSNYEFGGVPWENKTAEILKKNNPIEFVHKWSTPQLVIHGSKDYRLVESEGLGVFHALQQLKVPSRLVIFPDENHWVLNHGNSLKWHYEVFRWFDKFLPKKDD
ncbi:hypothetical protein K474DRAFT_1691388 [Panus rudis PR-1116 ss-1]|nr:hypothetical protein K474DRAFT_1691388 [Panus rudis PR-1116 ss-1]